MTNPYYLSAHWRALRLAALRRDGGRCAAPGCRLPAAIVDHIETRPRVPWPTEFDVLPNLRSLCRSHDNQVKELPGSARRRRGGNLAAKGCGPDGWPVV